MNFMRRWIKFMTEECLSRQNPCNQASDHAARKVIRSSEESKQCHIRQKYIGEAELQSSWIVEANVM